MRNTKIAIAVVLVAAAARPALAGRGSSPGAIQSAIASGGIDAVTTELERAEHLVCASCVPMVRPLLDHPDRRLRMVAAWWLARHGLTGDMLTTMTARLGGADSIQARNAADVLAELRLPAAVAPLGTALGNGVLSVDARVAAAQALGTIGDLTALTQLAHGFVSPDAPVRAAAVAAMRDVRGFADPTPALPLLADSDESVRIQAIYTVGATRGGSPAAAGAVPALVTLVGSDPSARVRKKAAWALGEIGASAAIAGPALAKAASSDSDPLVRSLAQAAQARLGR